MDGRIVMMQISADAMKKPSKPQMPADFLQRRCSNCPKKRRLLQRHSIRQTEPTAVPPIVHEVLRSSGQPLDAKTRAFMEPRFGHDFSRVRVHTDAKAAESARAVNALAYTVGQNVVFGEGQYVPETKNGQRILAHELTHVVQQKAPVTYKVDRISKDDAHEREAEHFADIIDSNPESLRRVSHRGFLANTLLTYRPRGSPNYGVGDTSLLKEEPFQNTKKNRDEKPWIEYIVVDFNNTKCDNNSELIPTGILRATYHVNRAKWSDFNVSVVGGSTSIGLSDRTNQRPVQRIEGPGYNDVPVPGGTGPHKKYTPNSTTGSMSYAVYFFRNKEAIHLGDLNEGSHACVHVGDEDRMRQVNYHTVRGLTRVTISYQDSIMTRLCCARAMEIEKQGIRIKKTGDIPKPCNNQDPTKCPGYPNYIDPCKRQRPPGTHASCSEDGNLPVGTPIEISARLASLDSGYIGSQPENGEPIFNVYCPPGQVCISGNCQPPEILPKENIEIQFNKDAPQWWYDTASSFKVSLTPEGRAAFEGLVAKMENQPTLRVQLEGYASSDKPANDEGYNRRLTDRRVRLIASELEKRGIPRTRFDRPADQSSPSGCEEIDTESSRGLLSCSDEGAKVPPDPSDRKVVASLFQ